MKHLTLAMILALCGIARAEGPISTFFGGTSFISPTANCPNLGFQSTDQLILIADENRIQIQDYDDKILFKVVIPDGGKYTDTDDFGQSNRFQSNDGKLAIEKVDGDLVITTAGERCVLIDGAGSQ